MRTIRLGYVIQFTPASPKFNGICFTSVKAADAPVLYAEIGVLLAMDAIDLVRPADMKTGFYSPCFILPKKGSGLRPVLDLRVNEWMMHLYSALLCIAVHPKRFTIMWEGAGGGLLNYHQCAASTWMIRRLPQDNGASALTTHQLQVERRES